MFVLGALKFFHEFFVDFVTAVILLAWELYACDGNGAKIPFFAVKHNSLGIFGNEIIFEKI